MAATKAFYVYVVKDENDTPLYVGKGSGCRHKVSAREHGGVSSIIEEMQCEDAAFKRERHWISELMPVNNKCLGGNGGRSSPACDRLPKILDGVMSLSEWKRERRSQKREEEEVNRVGARKYVAQFLLRKIDERNCEQWGVSKVDVFRLRGVANG